MVSKGRNRGHWEAVANVCKGCAGAISAREVGKALGSNPRRITGEAGRYYSGFIPWPMDHGQSVGGVMQIESGWKRLRWRFY